MPHDRPTGPDPDGPDLTGPDADGSGLDGPEGATDRPGPDRHERTDRPAPGAADGTSPAAGFRLLVVPGVSPGRWLRVWEQRLPDVPVTLVHATAQEAEEVLLASGADAGLVRLPVDRDRLSAIPLYTETTVVVVPTDHLVAAADDVVAADLADDVLLVPADDVLPWPDRPGRPSAMPAPDTTAQAVEHVASGVGVLAVPQSLARLHHRRDVTYRPVTDAPTSSVGLVWVTDATTDLVEELIGIVRGRTPNSSRGRGGRSAAASEPAGASGGRRSGAAGAAGSSDAGRGAGQGAGRGAAGRSGDRPAAGGRAAGGRSGAGGSRPGRTGGGRPRRRG